MENTNTIELEEKTLTKEDIRHQDVLNKIKESKTKNELPKVTLSTILKYFSDNAHFETKLNTQSFQPVYDKILEKGFFIAPEVKETFINVLKENYPGHTDAEYEEKYRNINPTKAHNLIIELYTRLEKIEALEIQEFKDKHNSIMKRIKDSFEISDLPSVGKGTLNGYLTGNSRVLPNALKAQDVYDISNDLMNGKDIKSDEMYNKLFELCKSKNEGLEEDLFLEYYSKLLYGDRVNYIVEEANARAKRLTEIYKENHDETMENIKNARRISQLPPNLSTSTLTGYLSGNTIIYPKTNPISTTKLTELTALLLKGKTFKDEDVQYELKKVAADQYPDKSQEAYNLLYDKLSALPRINYLVEEINYCNDRQQEFIGRGGSNVNLYLIPNPNSPMEGGRFYNCYINRIDNLDLSEIVPLNIQEIVPEGMDVDAIEWYVQENYDETFKTAGGIILNRDETIGNVNVFAPSDGRIGITEEQHTRYQELEEVSKRVKTIIAKKKEETDAFTKYQEEFLKRQQAIDEELALLEEKIDLLTSDDENKRGAR